MRNMIMSHIISGLLVLITSNIFAQTGYFTIKGEILIYDVGNVYIYLADEEFSKTPMAGNKVIVIEDNSTLEEFRRVPFQFDNVEEGTYAIRCYQDVNENEKLDKGMFGPIEPWWLSWQEESHSRIPKFKDIAFLVNSDIDNLQIDLDKNNREIL